MSVLLPKNKKDKMVKPSLYGDILDNPHVKVVRLSAVRTGHLYSPGNTPGTHFCYRLLRTQGHSAAGRIMSMTNPSDPNGN